MAERRLFDLLQPTARKNLEDLAANPYPGRGIVLGMLADGRPVQLYWLMGRSDNSRNRVLEAQPRGVLRTRAADPAKLTDPSLVIYTAMRELPGRYLVTNGDHTDSLHDGISHGLGFAEALAGRVHEPDGPNWTPRIAGEIQIAPGLEGNRVKKAIGRLMVIKADPFDSSRSMRGFFQVDQLVPGFGWMVTTYQGDGNPLPSFEGGPKLVALDGGPEDILAGFWQRLNAENRIALALKIIEADGGANIRLKNRFTLQEGSQP
ncbi:MAG: IMP cyclohydrolase [Deltaproteobacteria bacterium]|nr:IMP cyclohydrolase [Deltaproteobacteria bacterium]